MIVMGATRDGEMSRTAELLVELAKRYDGEPARVVMEVLHMLRSSNRTEQKDLSDLQNILDEKYKKRIDE